MNLHRPANREPKVCARRYRCCPGILRAPGGKPRIGFFRREILGVLQAEHACHQKGGIRAVLDPHQQGAGYWRSGGRVAARNREKSVTEYRLPRMLAMPVKARLVRVPASAWASARFRPSRPGRGASLRCRPGCRAATRRACRGRTGQAAGQVFLELPKAGFLAMAAA